MTSLRPRVKSSMAKGVQVTSEASLALVGSGLPRMPYLPSSVAPGLRKQHAAVMTQLQQAVVGMLVLGWVN